MKNLLKLKVCLCGLAFLVILQLTGCRNYFNPEYTVVLPEIPEPWAEFLGQPHWRVQWLDSGGQVRKIDIMPHEGLTVNIPVTWTNPVTAWPWWPEYNLIPGFFKPAGGLFPFDASDRKLHLTWEAGPDTVFYWELAYANKDNESKIPANFNWLRFRELFTTGDPEKDVFKDPWLVDWKYVAERTIAYRFESQLIKKEAAEKMGIPVKASHWYGTSPFAEPLVFALDKAQDGLQEFPIRPGINVWVSAEGILRVDGTTRIFAKTPSISYD